jgi:uncharacterized integral membrane protein
MIRRRSNEDPAADRGEDAPAARPTRHQLPRSRVGGVWVAAVLFSVVLLLLLIFVLENGQRADVSFLGAHGHLPMGVALLFAAVCGILLVALPGTGRIVQLRLLNRRRQRAHAVQPPVIQQPAVPSPATPPPAAQTPTTLAPDIPTPAVSPAAVSPPAVETAPQPIEDEAAPAETSDVAIQRIPAADPSIGSAG